MKQRSTSFLHQQSHPGEVLGPAGSSGYGGNVERNQSLQVHDGSVGTSKLDRDIRARHALSCERSAIGILDSIDDSVNRMATLLGERRDGFSHFSVTDDGDAHTSHQPRVANRQTVVTGSDLPVTMGIGDWPLATAFNPNQRTHDAAAGPHRGHPLPAQRKSY